MAMIMASLTFGIAALTTNTSPTHSAYTQSAGGTPTYI